MSAEHLFIGSYTASKGGEGTGITVFRLGESGELLERAASVAISSPSFLAVSGELLVVVSEDAEGHVSTYRRHGAELALASSVPSGGADPCHVAIDGGRHLVVANYSSGSLAIIPVGADGALGHALVAAAPPGSGPVEDRQEEPHVHQAVASELGDDRWLATDLGGDRVLEYRIVADRAPELVQSHPLPPGTGPRHMAWAHGALLVAGELDSRLHVVRRDGARLRHCGSASTVQPRTTVEGDAPSQPSHLAVTDDERFAYVANRGRGTISVFDLADLSNRDVPELVQETGCGGAWPRHFAVHGGRLYVANERSGDIAVFETDAATGLIGERIHSVPTGSPTCLVFA